MLTMAILVILDMDISYNSMFQQSDAFFTFAIFLLLSLPTFSGPLYDLDDQYLQDEEIFNKAAMGDDYLEDEYLEEEIENVGEKDSNKDKKKLDEDDYIRFFLIFSLLL